MSDASPETELVGAPADPQGRIERELAAQKRKIDRVVERMRRVKILSTLPYHKVPFWMDNLDSVLANPGPIWRRLNSPLGILDPWIALRLWWRARRYDAVVISGAERAEMLYLALAGLTPWIRTPHVIAAAEWQPDNGLIGKIQQVICRLGDRLLMQIQPHSPEETAIYVRNFGVPEEKFVPVPWSTSLIGYDLTPTKGDFILTGGLSYRDYGTFFEAIRQLPIPVEVGLPANHHAPEAKLVEDSPHVTLHTTLTNRQYMEKMAACRIFAMPVTPGLQRSTGDRTMLNAMYLRKVVVATDSIGPRIYIRHGENGFLVPEGDVEGWKRTLRRVNEMSDADYERIADQAEFDAKVRFNEEMLLCRTIEAVLDGLDARSTPSPSNASPSTR